jgi:hypothetical protein
LSGRRRGPMGSRCCRGTRARAARGGSGSSDRRAGGRSPCPTKSPRAPRQGWWAGVPGQRCWPTGRVGCSGVCSGRGRTGAGRAMGWGGSRPRTGRRRWPCSTRGAMCASSNGRGPAWSRVRSGPAWWGRSRAWSSRATWSGLRRPRAGVAWRCLRRWWTRQPRVRPNPRPGGRSWRSRWCRVGSSIAVRSGARRLRSPTRFGG